MRIPMSMVRDLIELGLHAFGKKRKVRKALQKLQESGTHYEAFISARDKLDVAADLGKSVSLSRVEVAALDFVMDQFTKTARRVKRKIN